MMPTPMETTVERFYAAPSKTQPGSWNVHDRAHTAPEGGHAVDAPHLTKDEALREAKRLNGKSTGMVEPLHHPPLSEMIPGLHSERSIYRARGDSLLAEHITDGDYLVVSLREPVEGEKVVATISGAFVVGTYNPRGERKVLVASRAADEPGGEVSVIGPVVGLIRKY